MKIKINNVNNNNNNNKNMKTKVTKLYCSSGYIRGQEIHLITHVMIEAAENNASIKRLVKNEGGYAVSGVLEVPGNVTLEEGEKFVVMDGNIVIMKFKDEQTSTYEYIKHLTNPCNYPFNINQ